MAKEYGLTPDYVLNELSYVNLVMYGSVVPSYDAAGKRGGKPEAGERLNADDPKNREKVRKILFG